jgi:hypothetical protein
VAIYTIIRIYDVPAENQIEATDRMMEAVALHKERFFHAKDIIRAPDTKPGQGKKISLDPPEGWLSLIKRQLIGNTG